MLKEIVIAFQSWKKAHQFLRQHKLGKWILLPGIMYAIFFIVAMILFWRSSDSVVSWISNQLRIEIWLQKVSSEWLSFLLVMMRLMLQLMLVLFYFSLFKYLILITGAPIFVYISQKTTAILEGKEFSYTWADLKKNAIRNIELALRNCGVQTIYFVALIILSLVPVVGWVAPLIALLLECYYYGFSMIDFALANQKYVIPQSIRYISYRKGLALGNGFLFYLMHALIVLAPAYAIVAATLSVQKMNADNID